jgi:NAD(P) transhydrogenase subunit alpha
MKIGIPKEILPGESRVAATPETVARLRQLGYAVMVEAGAGSGTYAADQDFRAAGADVVAGPEALFAAADLVLKVKQPAFNTNIEAHEAEMLKPGSLLVTFLHPAAPSNHAMIRTLAARGITSFSMDAVPRIPRAQVMDALTSMSTVTGYRSVLLAAGLLPRFVPLMGTAIGMVKPAKVLVVGAGVVGLQAIATARRLGASVSALDIREAAREEAKSLGASVQGFEVPEELSLGQGGYACALPREWLDAEQQALLPLAASADIVILSALVPGEIAPLLLTREMVEAMRPGSVVVDVSVDQGGNCEVTRAGEIIDWGEVQIVGIQNIPGSMPVDASWLYAQNVLHYLENLFKDGPGQIDWDDEIVAQSVVTRNGQVVHPGAAKAMQLA